MKLIITIDTEEDNWGSFSPKSYTLRNTERIPLLQEIFDEFDIKPTYLITYPVATDESAISILKEILKKDRCEIGSHCHPWNTPPFEEENTAKSSMLCNLPIALQYKKMSYLHNVIIKNFGIIPISFRAGRWGYSKDVAINLRKLGYKIDTSITPYMDWTGYYGPDFSDFSPQPFRFSSDNIPERSSNGFLLEIPATVGFLQKNFIRQKNILKMITRTPLNRFKLAGILYRLNLINKVWLSPELSDGKQMIRLTQCMMKNNYRLINMVFHSSSLIAGLTPFVKSKDDEKRFFQHIKEFLIFADNNGIEFIKLSDTLKFL